MKVRRRVYLSALGLALCFAAPAAAQNAASTRIAEFSKHWKAQLGPNINHLSSGARNFFNLTEQVEKLKATAAATLGGQQGGAPGQFSFQPRVPRLAAAKASAPDITDTRFSGAVQSETGTAWCGKQAVVSFNDSGSAWESGFAQFLLGLAGATTGWSFNGYAVSTNSGGSFTDEGFPTVGPVFTLMLGDGVMNCTDSSHFNLASLYEDFSVPGPSGCGFSDVSVSFSTNGGVTFGTPVVAASRDACFFFLDKEWMAVNQASPVTSLLLTRISILGTSVRTATTADRPSATTQGSQSN